MLESFRFNEKFDNFQEFPRPRRAPFDTIRTKARRRVAKIEKINFHIHPEIAECAAAAILTIRACAE